MKKGDWIDTPRFCKVQLDKVFQNEANAKKAGYTEPTHTRITGYEIVGKSIDMYHMTFAAYKK
ncbi:MAG: hypothetical protein RR224_12525 [Clostridia bacterium]